MHKILIRNILSITTISLMGVGPLYAQYCNEWINFGQEYYKISLASDGAYRLSYVDLQQAGIPIHEIDPKTIQLFHRGEEQALCVKSQLENTLSPGDFIAFYGQRNDGTNDTKLYDSPAQQPHTHYNIYSDTSAYFLTWGGAMQGKRMPTFANTNTNAIPKENYHYQVKREIYHDEYAEGNTVQHIFRYTQFDQGEGWTGLKICTGSTSCENQIDYVIADLDEVISTATPPQLEIALMGRSEGLHIAQLYIGTNTSSLRLLTTARFSGYETPKVTVPFEWNDIGSGGQVTVRVKLQGTEDTRNELSVSYIQITHPQRLNMKAQSTKWFLLKEQPAGTSYIEIENAESGLSVWDVTSPHTVKQIGMYQVGNTQGGIVPNTTHQRSIFAYYDFLKPAIKHVQFRPINPSAFDYIIVSHTSLMKPAQGYENPVQAYGDYRLSAAGGMHKPLIVTTDELYNQFNYGETSALAIYQFMKYMVDRGSPHYLFLIGKGLDVSYDFHRKTTSALNGLQDLVPSAGMPGSDMAFTAGLDGVPFVPAVATGRITANTSDQVAAYLKKIIETETSPPNNLWRKRILHLSGGIEKAEMPTFREYLDSFGEIAQKPHYGGIITTIGKREPNPIELINVSEEVNKGLNFITFFGHSSPTTIDIDIGFATDPIMGYNNVGKYPMFLINGCNAGVFFSHRTAFGEDWVLADKKGARGFIAHSSYGLVSMLRTYTRLFYEIGYTDSKFKGMGIGTIQTEVAKRFLDIHPSSISAITQVQQMVLLGDPAVKLFPAVKPDFETSDGAIFLDSFDEKPVTALTDSFAVKIIVKNFGAISQDNLEVQIRRTFNDNSTVSYDSIFPFLQSEDTLVVVVKKRNEENSFGNNQFKISLDFANKISELNEENNEATLQFFIPSRGTKNILPQQYAIVNKKEVTLTWQNSDIQSTQRDYYIEIDTIATFGSPFAIRNTITGDAVLDFRATLLATDSLAYYWRTRLANPSFDEKADWTMSSFTYIKDSEEGWTQGHFSQFAENKRVSLVADPLIRGLKFQETSAAIAVTTFAGTQPSLPRPSFKINEIEYNLATQFQPCRQNTINFVAMDKTTLIPYAAIPFIFQDPRTCGREPQVINSFTLAEIETDRGDDLPSYIDNLGVSDRVVIFSIGDAGYPSWPVGVVAKLNELGIGTEQIAALKAGEPVVIFAKKGAPAGTAAIHRLPQPSTNEQVLGVNKTLVGKKVSGHMYSTLIGPAQSWQRFIPMVKNVETSDQYTFDIIGLDLVGNKTALFTGISQTIDITAIPATQYPLLQVKINMKDTIDQTTVQLHRWIVHYTPVAEGILMYKDSASSVNVLEGNAWQAVYTFKNVSQKTFPSTLQATFEIFNKASRQQEKKTIAIAAPLPGCSTTFFLQANTNNKVGWNDIIVFVNPKVYPEQYYYNNIVELQNHLYVEREKIMPVIDLTIDGRYIIDGDFVSSNPIINIKILDESYSMLKKDPSGVRILLKPPCEDEEAPCNFNLVEMSSDDIQWYPATLSSPFEILFQPQNLPKGQHVLQVEGEDGSGNKPATPYKISFVIDNGPFIHFSPLYPNPSSSWVFFDFTVVGDAPPHSYYLQIMAPDGKVIYTLTMKKEALHIGLNRAAWDGKDTQGNIQKKGLYLYRQIIEWNDKREVNTGRFFLLL